MRDLVLIAHDIRSRHNIGSLIRTAEGIGVNKLYITGYTPYPQMADADPRLPHIASKESKEINKTALGAEFDLAWERLDSITELIADLKAAGYVVVALEQTADSIQLDEYAPPDKVALLLGREVEGIDPDILKICDVAVEIPMFGRKESFNVVQAAAMALFWLRFAP